MNDKSVLNTNLDYASLGKKYFQMGEYQLALSNFNTFQSIEPNDPEVNYYLALLTPRINIIIDQIREKSIDENLYIKFKSRSNYLIFKYIDERSQKLSNHLSQALKTEIKERKDTIIEYQSVLLFNNRIIDKFQELHEKYGYSNIERFKKVQLRRMAVINLILNKFDEAESYFLNDLNNEDNLFYLGVISFLRGDKHKALNYFESSYRKNNKIIKTLYNLIMNKLAINDKSYCSDLIKLKRYKGWSNIAYSLLYNNCGYYEYDVIPTYKEERYDAGGYTDSRGRYVPDYQIKKIKIGERKEKIYPSKVSLPKTSIFITCN